MAKKKEIFICSACGKQFTDGKEYRSHESICNKCKTCKNAYYVYGVAFNCPYEADGTCKYSENFPKYISEDN